MRGMKKDAKERGVKNAKTQPAEAPPVFLERVISIHEGTCLAEEDPCSSLTVEEEEQAMAIFREMIITGSEKKKKKKKSSVPVLEEAGEHSAAVNACEAPLEISEAAGEVTTQTDNIGTIADGRGDDDDTDADDDVQKSGLTVGGVKGALHEFYMNLEDEGLFEKHVVSFFRGRGLDPENDRLDLAGFLELLSSAYAPGHKYGSRLRKACSRNDACVVKELLARGCNPLGCDGGGFSSLHAAAQFGHVPIIEILLAFAKNPPARMAAQIADLVAAADAAEEAEEASMQTSRRSSNGGQPEVVDQGNSDEANAPEAQEAAAKNFYVLNRTFESCLLEARDNQGHTPLMVASACGKKDAVGMLVSAGADVTASSVDEETRLPLGRTALHWACAKGRQSCVPLLLASPNCDVNCADSSGWTPLHCALFHGHATTAALLMKAHKAKPDVKDLVGKSPKDYAGQETQQALADALQKPSRRQSQAKK